MKVNIKNLLTQLAQTDTSSPEFLDISKKIVEVIKQARKEHAEKPLKIKTPKVKPPKVKLCDDCSQLLIVKLNEILPEEI
jgi:uracil phosphoribosyltransferase